MIRLATSVFLTVGTVWLLTGCRPDFSQETAAVDSMLRVMDAVDVRVAALDTSAILAQTERVDFECNQLRLEYLDISDTDLLGRLDTLCAYAERAQQTLGRTRILVNELSKTRKQLSDLRIDLQLRRANKEAVTTYIEVEFLYVESLSGLLDELEERFANDQLHLDQFRLEVDSLMAVAAADMAY